MEHAHQVIDVRKKIIGNITNLGVIDLAEIIAKSIVFERQKENAHDLLRDICRLCKISPPIEDVDNTRINISNIADLVRMKTDTLVMSEVLFWINGLVDSHEVMSSYAKAEILVLDKPQRQDISILISHTDVEEAWGFFSPSILMTDDEMTQLLFAQEKLEKEDFKETLQYHVNTLVKRAIERDDSYMGRHLKQHISSFSSEDIVDFKIPSLSQWQEFLSTYRPHLEVGKDNILYHVTPLSNLDSIQRCGLIPSKGERSQKISGENTAIYCFRSRLEAEEAIQNWLGEEFEEDEPLVLLKINCSGLSFSENPLEVQVQEPITTDRIIVEDRTFGDHPNLARSPSYSL